MPEPTWKRVQRNADRLTPLHVAELAAVKWFSLCPAPRCPTMRGHGDVPADLVRWRLLTGERVPGWRRDYRLLNLTELGERVLLELSERAMVQTGAMARVEADDGDA